MLRICPVGTNITWMLYECSILVEIFWTNYEHFSNVQVLTFMGCSYFMSYECLILIGMSCTKNEHSCNLQVGTFLECSDLTLYINIKLRYFLFHENWTVNKFFHCTDNFQCSDKIQDPSDSISIQLWTFYEHSHLNIHTIFILNYEGIIFEYSPKHSWNVPWMLPCPLGVIRLNHLCSQRPVKSIIKLAKNIWRWNVDQNSTNNSLFKCFVKLFPSYCRKYHTSKRQFIENLRKK